MLCSLSETHQISQKMTKDLHLCTMCLLREPCQVRVLIDLHPKQLQPEEVTPCVRKRRRRPILTMLGGWWLLICKAIGWSHPLLEPPVSLTRQSKQWWIWDHRLRAVETDLPLPTVRACKHHLQEEKILCHLWNKPTETTIQPIMDYTPWILSMKEEVALSQLATDNHQMLMVDLEQTTHHQQMVQVCSHPPLLPPRKSSLT